MVRAGVYKHFKGGQYLLTDVAYSSDDPSRRFCVYRSLEGGRVWVRPLEEWEEIVTWDDGVKRPRFVRGNCNG